MLSIGDIVLLMNAEQILADTASLFLALGDRTRLRLLNLMRDREICVSDFTSILGQSQPLISRHLAYLRNAGLVTARRDGKWMHYRISSELDENGAKLLFELFKWMESQDGLRADREKYIDKHGHVHVQPSSDVAPRRPQRKAVQFARRVTASVEPAEVIDEPRIEEPELELDRHEPIRHNELEDFLL